MKTNVLIVVIVLGFLLVGGGIYLFTQYYKPVADNNQPPPASGGTFPEGTSGQTHNIEISGFAFSPSDLTIQVGDTVIWTNKDSVSHTITSDGGTELGSSNFGKDGTYSHTFNTVGTYAYHCSIHSTMKGTIVVE